MAGMKLVKKGALLDRRAETIAGVPAQSAGSLPPAPAGAVKSLSGESFEDSINRLLDESRDRFVLIGEILLDWKASLPHGHFMRVFNERVATGALRNISYQSAHRYMTVAAALRSGAVEAQHLPDEPNAAYLIASLNPGEIALARKEGLVRPTVRKAEVAAFRKRLRSPSPAPQTDRRAELEGRRARLLAELAEVERELAGLT